ncbi:YcdB/YcdC domain-containing protein [Cellulosilyticum sp. I15G10I2]|uniref:YcdB/YcdC domain-containing protein n=1 Tax=Cellulosilyticum sp. I15G10I2 TaxID=1892843 RepID=UPI00085C7EBB|nr:YcdB/YcdC domain-containing protein [Cellulosilyticum sp. I15G10I2]
MNIKKIAAFFLIIMLVLPTAVWGDNMDKELSQLITSVKNKINVPSELTEFRYSLDVQNEETKENLYRLSWEDKAYKIGSVQVVAEKNGNIVNYSKYMYNKEYSILAKVSYEEGLKNAKSFLSKVASHYTKQLKLQEQVNINQSNTHEYRFDHYVNDVKVSGETVTIHVDKQTGEVVNFYGISTYKGTYGSNQAVVTLEKAKESYLNQIGVSLIHHIYYDYESRTIKSFPVYEANNRQSKAIDAKTGQIIIPFRENIFYTTAKEDAAMGVAPRDAGNVLTPEEQKVVDEIKGLITKEKAVEGAVKYFPKLEKASIVNAYLNKSVYENQYTWQIHLQNDTLVASSGVSAQKEVLMIAAGDIKAPSNSYNMNLSVDAKTGEILSYSSYHNYEPKESTASESQIKAKVETFLKSIAKDKFALTKYQEIEEYTGPIPLDMNQSFKSYYYRRTVNGIPVQGDGLRVTYDVENDEVTSYSSTWHKVAFKDVTKVIDKQKIIDQIGLELMYINRDSKTRVLAYAHQESYMTFDPYTGERVNSYDGKPLQQSAKTAYDDIKGHAKEDIIKKLYDSGIYLPGSSFKPDTNINQYDFLRLVLRITEDNITEDELYDRAINRGIIEKKEKNKNLIITKELAVKYLINSTNYKEVAKLSEIYAYPFKDEKSTAKELKGYIALAYGLKIVEQDKTINFNPKAKLTRADATVMIYNLLLLDK